METTDKKQSSTTNTLSLYVKKNKLELTENCYQQFGWTKTNSKDNNLYEDTIDVTFSRPHNIKNKDDLQFLQVDMENKLNELARLEKTKHQNSIILGLVLCPILMSLFIWGIYQLFTFSKTWIWYLGISAAGVSAFLIALLGIMLKKLINNENNAFLKKTEEIQKELTAVCLAANKLWSDNNE